MNWKEFPLIDILDYDQPNEYIVETTIKDEETPIPVLTANKSFIKGYTNETKGIYKNVPVIIFDDFTTDNKYVTFPFKVKSSAMKILKTKNKDILLKFVFYQMQLKKINFTTHKRYYISIYQNLNFLFPVNQYNKIDLQEQQLIVDEIEKQFTRLDASVKDLESVKEKLEIYRKSVLKAAFNKKWICGDSTEIFKWTNGKGLTKKQINDGNFPVYGGNGVTGHHNEFLNKKQSIVVGRVGAHCGNIHLAPEKSWITDNAIYSSEIYKDIIIEFYQYYLKSKNLNSLSGGTGQPYVSQKILNSIKVPIVDKEIQTNTLDFIESKLSVIGKFEEILNNSLIKTELLRKSILKSAFEGKLVVVND